MYKYIYMLLTKLQLIWENLFACLHHPMSTVFFESTSLSLKFINFMHIIRLPYRTQTGYYVNCGSLRCSSTNSSFRYILSGLIFVPYYIDIFNLDFQHLILYLSFFSKIKRIKYTSLIIK